MKVLLCDLVTDGHHLEYAGYLADTLVGSAHEVTFVTSAGASNSVSQWASEHLIGVEYLSVAKPTSHPIVRNARTYRAFVAALRLAKEKRADILHFLYADRSELALAAALATANAPAEVFVTSFWPHYLPRFSRAGGALRRTYSATVLAALRQSLKKQRIRSIFVHDESVQTELIGSIGRALPPESIQLIPDPGKFEVETTELDPRRRLGIRDEGPVILFFGGFREDKGLDVLLNALPSVTVPCTAVVAGPPYGFPKEAFEQCRRRLPSHVHLDPRPQRIPDEDVDYYFAASTLVVLPYKRHSIGTSGVLQRAAAAHRPVIASRTGLIGGIVERNQLGVTVEPECADALAGAISSALLDLEFVSSRVNHLEDYAQRHDWRITSSKVIEAYSQSLQPSSTSSRANA